MATLVEATNQKRECFEKVLEINPDNMQAKNSLLRLSAGENQARLLEKTKDTKVESGKKFLGVLLFISSYVPNIFL